MDKKKTALLLIDLQKESNYELLNIQDVIGKAKELISRCRQQKIPIVYTRQVNRGDGLALPLYEPVDSNGEPVYYNSRTDQIEIFDELAPEKGDVVVDKHRWSAFFETSLDLILKSMKVEHLITGGLVTDGCVMNTVFDAFSKDYQVSLVKDICTTTNEGAQMASILIMCNWVNGLEVYDTKEMINKLTGQPHRFWKWSEPDELKFQAENLKEVFSRLQVY